MKTKTNLTLFFIATVTTISLTSCRVDFNQKNSVTGNNKVTTEERVISESFSSIEVQEGITLYLTHSSDKKLTVEADENTHSSIQTSIKNGKLKVYCEPNIRKSKARNIYVSIDGINELETSSGGRIISENSLLSANLNATCSSGSSMNLQVKCKNIHLSTSSGSNLMIKGTTNNLSAKSSSGSSIDAYELEANLVESKASSGSHISVTAREHLKGKASSGASITHKGNPKNIEIKTSSGGNVSAG
ncbi:head GIN domain-containing protein [Flavicella marina]|uniref:head GIN domain-containing protein n=1 Tax=Flavicella marina TaxID=1475951 RepID=UPI0012642DD1|nr:head GIN domain-containing protein [Flavicella marina]